MIYLLLPGTCLWTNSWVISYLKYHGVQQLLDTMTTPIIHICITGPKWVDQSTHIHWLSYLFSIWYNRHMLHPQLNSLCTSDTIWHWRSWSTMVQAMAFHLLVVKPLSEPMLNKWIFRNKLSEIWIKIHILSVCKVNAFEKGVHDEIIHHSQTSLVQLLKFGNG